MELPAAAEHVDRLAFDVQVPSLQDHPGTPDTRMPTGESHDGARPSDPLNLPGRSPPFSTTSPPTRSQGLTVRSKATGDRPSPFLPFHLDVRGARGFRVARHPIARMLTAKGCRMRRSGGKEARERRDDRHAPEPGRPTGGKSPLGQASEKRNFLYSGVRLIRLRPRAQGRGVTRGTGAGP